VQLRAAAGVVVVQPRPCSLAAVVRSSKTVTSHPDSVARALLGAARALLRHARAARLRPRTAGLRWTARTPVVVLELLALPVSYSLGFQAGLDGLRAPILLSALACSTCCSRPRPRAARSRAREVGAADSSVRSGDGCERRAATPASAIRDDPAISVCDLPTMKRSSSTSRSRSVERVDRRTQHGALLDALERFVTSGQRAVNGRALALGHASSGTPAVGRATSSASMTSSSGTVSRARARRRSGRGAAVG